MLVTAHCWIALAQKVEHVIYQSEVAGWLLQSACQCTLGQDTEARVAVSVFIGVWMLDRKHSDIEKKVCVCVNG